jgi:beta-1,4-galactosyltransferase 6
MCPFSEGPMDVNMTQIAMEEIDLKFSKYLDVHFGGHWRPKDCKPRWKVHVDMYD